MRFIFLLLFLFISAQGTYAYDRNVRRADSLIKLVIHNNNPKRDLILNSTAYLKNTLILNKAPKRILGSRVIKLLKLKHSGEQVLYLHESNSQLRFTKEGEIKEEITNSKTYGDYKTWEFTRASKMQLNFNKDYVKLEGFSNKKFVSPIAKNAFRFYEYYLEESLVDEFGNQLEKIRIRPKKLLSPAFYGYIYINNENLQITKLSLNLGDNAGISFVNNLTVEQDLIKIDNIYYPVKTQFKYNGGGLGIKFEGNCTAIFNYESSNYADDIKFKKHETLIIDKQTESTENFLRQNRPIPLTDLENKTYSFHDSLKKAQGEKKYLDSLDRLTLRQRMSTALFNPIVLKKTFREYAFKFDPIIPSLFYNTVEGAGIKYGVEYTKFNMKDGGYYVIKPEIRYGFGNKQFNSDLSFSWLFNPHKRSLLNFSIGSSYQDLNPNGSLSSLYNSISTLIFEQNFMKLFRKDYISASAGTEITNGWYISGGLEYAKNVSATNLSDYSMNKIKDKNFTSNDPLDPSNEGKLFPDYTGLRLSTTLIYTFKHNYISNKGIKYYEIPTHPRLIFTYKKGIKNIFGSETNYDFFEAEIQQEKLDLGLWGYGSFSLSVGKFLRNKQNFYPEWKHFSGNMALIFNQGLKSFHLLDFYKFSTDNSYIETHWEHSFNSKFFGRVPLLRKLKLQELGGFALLAQPGNGTYMESYIGVRRLGVRADYAISYDNDGYIRQGFKLSFNIQSPYKTRRIY